MMIRWILSVLLSFSILFALANKSNALAQSEVNQINSSLIQNVISSSSKSLWPHLINHFSLSSADSNIQVQRQLVWWLEHKKYLDSVLVRSKPYLAYIYEQTRVKNIPAEFALLPAIESDYNPFAYSKAGATGLWQMMSATATNQQLIMNWWYDGRRDTVASTKAALDYLGVLHEKFGDWLLAAAAYNDGMGAIQAAQARAHAAHFWQLALPTETKHYVTRLLALTDIIAHAKHYHIKLPSIRYQSEFTKVNLTSQLDLAEIAHLAETNIETIKNLNPGMLRFATDPNIHAYLLLPRNKTQVFLVNLNRVKDQEHVSWRYHQVQQDETFAKLCQVFHTNKMLLKWVNNLPAETLSVRQGVLVPLQLHETFGHAYLAKASVDRRFQRDQEQIQAAIDKLYHSVV